MEVFRIFIIHSGRPPVFLCRHRCVGGSIMWTDFSMMDGVDAGYFFFVTMIKKQAFDTHTLIVGSSCHLVLFRVAMKAYFLINYM